MLLRQATAGNILQKGGWVVGVGVQADWVVAATFAQQSGPLDLTCDDVVQL
jgi:hypothetical protein